MLQRGNVSLDLLKDVSTVVNRSYDLGLSSIKQR